RRHTRSTRDWSSDVCSSDLKGLRATLARISSSANEPVGGDQHRRKSRNWFLLGRRKLLVFACALRQRYAVSPTKTFSGSFLLAGLAVSFLFHTMDSNASETNLPALQLIGSRRPLVIGHRGYCQFAPENTLPPFK